VRGSASDAGALIEVEVRDRSGVGRIVCGRLVEVEIVTGVEGETVLRLEPGTQLVVVVALLASSSSNRCARPPRSSSPLRR
jgi:hypothetical protein